MLFLELRKKMADVQRASCRPTSSGPTSTTNSATSTPSSTRSPATAPSYAQLKEVAEGAAPAAARVPDVTKVDLYGAQGERIFVEFSHAKLATLGMPPQALFDSLAKQNALDARRRVPDRRAARAAARHRRARRRRGGRGDAGRSPTAATFRLGDIATVTHGYDDPPSFLIRAQRASPRSASASSCRRAAIFSRSARTLDERDRRVQKPSCRRASTIDADRRPAEGGRRARSCEFMRSFLEALAIVLRSASSALGWRIGHRGGDCRCRWCWRSSSSSMSDVGLDLQRITLGALIIALGLLVDDAIIAVEMMVVKMEQGWDRVRAASFAWTSTAFPMLTGTLVTAAGFLPIGLANSAVGEYAGGIFWVVGIALVASWFVAVMFTPYLGVKLLPNITAEPQRTIRTRSIRTPVLSRASAARSNSACVDHSRHGGRWRPSACFALSIVGFGHVQQQFFPLSERPELFFELRLAGGHRDRASTEKVGARRRKRCSKGDDDVATYTTYVGKGSPRFWLGLQPGNAERSLCRRSSSSPRTSRRASGSRRGIETAVADGALSEARVRVDRFNFGPPVGFPVQFRVIGPDPRQVRDIAYRVRDVMRSRQPRHRSAARLERADAFAAARGRPGPRPRARPDAAGRRAGAADADRRRAGDDGARRRREGRRGRARGAVRTRRARPGRRPHRSTRATASRCRSSQIAKIEYAPRGADPVAAQPRHGDHRARRRRRRRRSRPTSPAAIWPKLQEIRDSLPPGYRIEMGGAIEESAKGNASIFVLFPMMVHRRC